MSSVDALSEIIAYLNLREFSGESCGNGSVDGGDPAHPLYARENRVNARYANFDLASRLQPIVQLEDDSISAHEAFLQAQTPAGIVAIGRALAPENLFALPRDIGGITYLDRLTRTLHALNFLLQDTAGDLHLNVHPHHLLAVTGDHGRVFEAILQQCGLAPANIVLEVQEHSIRDRQKLARAIAAWQSRGYRIAVDNFGRDHLQIDRVLKLRPDLIKLDGSLLHECAASSQRAHVVKFIAESARATGIELIATGIETPQQRQLAEQIGARFGQGYLLGRPALDCRRGDTPDDGRSGGLVTSA